jgi:hypothetical protein
MLPEKENPLWVLGLTSLLLRVDYAFKHCGNAEFMRFILPTYPLLKIVFTEKNTTRYWMKCKNQNRDF